MKFADITNDVAFRKIFGSEQSPEPLISFLNAVLDFEGDRRVASVTILNPYQTPGFRDGKATIIDVKARDQRGREFIVEMQVANIHGFSKRALYYASQGYVSQIERGEFYDLLRPTIFIGILDFSISKNPNFLSRHQIRDVETGERVVEDMEFNFIELPKFQKSLAELRTPVEKWVFFIKEAENLEVIPDGLDDDGGLQKAFVAANVQTWTKDDFYAYDYASMREKDEAMKIKFADETGERRGFEKGIEKGMEKGGHQKALEIARQLRQMGLDDPAISAATGLEKADLETL